MTSLALRFTAIALSVIFLSSCQTMRSMERSVSQQTIPAEQETLLGDEYSVELTKEMKFIEDPAVQQWIDEVGAKLVANSPECPQSFKFKVTAEEAINAFAIPGGYCYVNAGLIAAAENEAQVVAVVGHEINHVTMRHGVVSLQRQVGIEVLAEKLSPASGSGAAAVALVKNAGGVVAMRTFGREDEREADRYGVEAMYKAGWDPRQAAAFFKILQAQEGGSGKGSFLTQIISTHPTTTERIQNIEAQVAEYKITEDLVVDRPEFREVQKIVAEHMKAHATEKPAEATQ